MFVQEQQPQSNRPDPKRSSHGDGLPRRSIDLAPGLAVVVATAAVASLLASQIGPLSSLVAAVILGAVLGNVGLVKPVLAPGFTFATKQLLRFGVVLLGLRLSLGDLAALGPATLAVVAATVGSTFFGTQWLGRRMGLSRDLSLLIATGYSICGASAIVAVEGSTDADEEEVLTAIGLVTLFGSLAVFALPFLAGVLGLSDVETGTWIGASTHDVAQVVAASSAAGGSAVMSTAIVVKLSRVVLLAPIVAGVNLHRARAHQATDAPGPPLVPVFVVGFLAALLVRTTGVLPEAVVGAAKTVEGMVLSAALVGLGSGVRVNRLRSLGPKPLLLGIVAWAVVACVSLAGVGLVS